MNRKISTGLGILVLIVIVFPIVYSIFIFQKIVEKDIVSLRYPTFEKTLAGYFGQKEGAFEEWKLYQAKQYGFQINYPEGWTIKEDEESCKHSIGGEFDTVIGFKERENKGVICIDVATNKDKLSLVEYFKKEKEKESDESAYFPFVGLHPKKEVQKNGLIFHKIYVSEEESFFLGAFEEFIFNIYTQGERELFEIKEKMVYSFQLIN